MSLSAKEDLPPYTVIQPINTVPAQKQTVDKWKLEKGFWQSCYFVVNLDQPQ